MTNPVETAVVAAVRKGWVDRATSFVGGFVHEDARQSSSRLLAIIFGAVACYCGYKTVAFAFANPHDTASIIALGSTTVGALTGGMATALGFRKRKADGTPDADPGSAS